MEKELGVERQTATLASGVPVVSYYKPGAPISVQVCFLSGSRYEPADQPGLAHFSEHMLVSGTERFPSKDSLARYFDRFGGNYNAFTGADRMALTYSLADADDFSHIAVMLDECLHHSLIEEATLRTEQGAVAQELAMSTSRPQNAVGKLFYSLMFQGTPLDTNILGTAESIKGFSQTAVRKFFTEYLTTDRMTIVVAGGISAIDATKHFDQVAKSGKSTNRLTQIVPTPLPIIRKRIIEVAPFNDNNNIEVVVGFRTTPFNHADNAAQYVLNRILGAPRIGKLFMRLRGEEGLVYAVGAGSSRYADAGASYIDTSCKKTDLAQVLRIIGEECASLVRGEITAEDVSFIIERESKGMKLGMQTSGSWVSNYATDELYGIAKSLDEDMADLRAVTVEDVQRVAAKYFTNNNWYIALAGNITESEVSFSI